MVKHTPTADHAIDSRRGYAMLLMVISSVVISFGGLVMRYIEAADPWQINFYRSGAMLAAVTVILFLRYRGNALSIIANIGRLGVIAGALLSVAGIAFIQALASTTIANALFILGGIPFIAALFARIFLKEKLRRTTLATMLLAACGLVIMLWEGLGAGSGYGNAMALLTALCFALYAVVVRYKRQTEMLPTLILSAVFIMLIALVAKYGDLYIPLRDLLLCFLWGAVLSGLVNWMFIIASRHLAAAEVTLIMLLEFALGPLWVWLFVGETPALRTLAGGTLVIFAVALRAIIEMIKKPRPEQTMSGPV